MGDGQGNHVALPMLSGDLDRSNDALEEHAWPHDAVHDPIVSVFLDNVEQPVAVFHFGWFINKHCQPVNTAHCAPLATQAGGKRTQRLLLGNEQFRFEHSGLIAVTAPELPA